MRPLVRVATAGCLAALSCVAFGGSAAPPAESGVHTRALAPTELVLLEDAEQVLIKRCMRRKGFDYWVARSPAPAELRRFGHVIDDVSWARENGYGGRFDRAAEAEQRDNPNRAYAETLSERRRAELDVALWGSPAGGVLSVELPGGPTLNRTTTGCQAEAQHTLYGDLPRWFRASAIAGGLSHLYTNRIERDPRLHRAERAWSACMRRSGLGYASPAEVRADLPRLTRGHTPAETDAAETRLAVAEATCALRSPLAKVARELDRQYGDPVRNRYRDSIEATARMRIAALPRASRTVQGRGAAIAPVPGPGALYLGNGRG